jgi:transposase
MVAAPWIVPDELWELVEPLLPKRERRFRYPARTRLKSEDVHDAAGCHGRVVREMDRVNRRATTELGSFALFPLAAARAAASSRCCWQTA